MEGQKKKKKWNKLVFLSGCRETSTMDTIWDKMIDSCVPAPYVKMIMPKSASYRVVWTGTDPNFRFIVCIYRFTLKIYSWHVFSRDMKWELHTRRIKCAHICLCSAMLSINNVLYVCIHSSTRSPVCLCAILHEPIWADVYISTHVPAAAAVCVL